MDELIQAMSIAELTNFKATYKENESITKIIEGYIEVKTRQEAQAKAQADFAKAIAKLADKLSHPEDIHNVYLAWAKGEEPIPDSEPEEVMVDGEPTMRQPMQEVWGWHVEVNKGFQVTRGTSTPVASKRSITLNKRDGQTLNFVGNYLSASKACEALSIPVGSDSATRVLQRDGYILDPYTGTDFQS